MKRFHVAFLILLFAACAQTRELSGGAKDTIAPLLLSAEPPDGTVRFANDRITLRFNERVRLDRVRDRLLISPPLEKIPDVTIRAGQEVVIHLRAPLLPNTTYTFNIGDAVTDITENNSAAGLTYVVSTGNT
ncbi:MAG TPA: Ig-like domain-containing protein, partial [Flavobacteriales bacterium]|nr:Ig-like domain-containing protein [Flavobacteriales bacterium]